MDTHISIKIKTNIVKVYNLCEFEENSIIFKIKEYDLCSFIFMSESENCIFFIDTHKQDHLNCQKNYEYTLNVSTPNYNLVPGIYEIQIIQNEEKKIFNYEVESSNINEFQYNNMITSINNLFKGIVLDYETSRTIWGESLNFNIFDNYEEQYELWKKTRQEINYVLNYPSSTLKKNYIYSSKIEKFDNTVLKFINTKQIRSGKYIQPKIEKNLCNHDNAMLYLALKYYYSDISSNLKYIIENINILKDQKENFLNLLNDKTNELNILNSKFNKGIYSEKYINSVYSRKKYLTYQINNIEQKIEKISYLKDLVSIMQGEVYEEILNLTNLIQDIDVNKYYNGSIKDMRYKNIIDNLNIPKYNIQDSKYNQKRLGFSLKKTQLLFEYYCFLQILNIIFMSGFKCTKGWILKAMNSNYEMDIPSECDNYFEKDNIQLVVSYDKEFPYNLVDGYKGMFSSNSQHRRPDITIMLYENGEFKKTLICEVKYRNTRYIYDDFGDTSVVTTMRDYYQLWYCDTITKYKNRSAVSSVLLLYPQNKYSINYENFLFKDEMKFIPMQLNKTSIEEDWVEVELFKEVSEFLNIF